MLDTNDKETSTASKAIFPENETSPSSPNHQATGQEKYGLLNVTNYRMESLFSLVAIKIVVV